MKTLNRLFAYVVFWLSLIVFSFLIILPLVADALVDYNHPTKVEWVTNEKGEIEKDDDGNKKYNIEFQYGLEKFNQLSDLPIKFGALNIFIICLISVFTFFVSAKYLWKDEYFEDLMVGFFVKTLIVQILFYILSVVILFNIPDYNEHTVIIPFNDKELLERIVSRIEGNLVFTFLIGPFFFYIVSDLIAFMLIFIMELTQNFLEKIIRKIFYKELNFNERKKFFYYNREENRAELIKMDFEIKWFPFLRVVPIKKVVNWVSTDTNNSYEEYCNFIQSYLEPISDSLENKVRDNLSKLDMSNNVIFINQFNKVEIAEFSGSVDWRPFPIASIKKNVKSTMDLSDFFAKLLFSSKDSFFHKLRKDIIGSYSKKLRNSGEETVDSLIHQVGSDVGEEIENKISVLKKNEHNLEDSKRIVQGVSDDNLDNFKQEIILDVCKSVREYVKEGLIDPIVTSFRSYLNTYKQEMGVHETGRLFEGTKFFLSKGNRSISIIEQAPQVRTVAFSSSFRELNEDERFLLSFPYVIFMVYISGKRFNSLRVFYSKEPLNSLDQDLYNPNLPNIDIDADVCLGFPCSNGNNTVYEEVERVISHFWQSYFNSDRNSNYVIMTQEDKRLANLKKWEKNSEKDPNFVLDVNWQKTNFSISNLKNFFEDADEKDYLYDVRNEVDKVLRTSCNNLELFVLELFESIKTENVYDSSINSILNSKFNSMYKNICEEIKKSFLSLVDSKDDSELYEKLSKISGKKMNEVVKNDFKKFFQKLIDDKKIEFNNLSNVIRRG